MVESYKRSDWEETGGEECPYCGEWEVDELCMIEGVHLTPSMLQIPCRCKACGETWWMRLRVEGFEEMPRRRRGGYWRGERGCA